MGQTIKATLASEFIGKKLVEWIWYPYLPQGRTTILDGDPGLGKSFVALEIAAKITRGTAWPGKHGEDLKYGPNNVVICNCEDEKATCMVPRLRAAGADMARVTFGDSVQDDQTGKTVRTLSLPEDRGLLEKTILMAEAKLVIIDPVMSFLSERVRTQSDQSVRNALNCLNHISEEFGTAFLLVRHLNKGGGTKALYRGGGSIGFVGLARSALMVARDPDIPKQSLLMHFKSNVGPIGPSQSFKLKFAGSVGKVVWLGESKTTANQALKEVEEPTELGKAVEFVKTMLAGGRRAILELIALGKEQGFSAQTIMRCKTRLTLFVSKNYYRGRMCKFWSLGPDAQDNFLNKLPVA